MGKSGKVEMEEKTKYIVRHTSQFKKDYKKMIKLHLRIDELKTVVAMLANGIPLQVIIRYDNW